MTAPIERTFAVPGLALAAREWGKPGGLPVIALHGWLDNAGTFDLLAPLLEKAHIVALDSAGHGLSGHRSADATYNIWQDVPEVFAVADQLGWQRFALLGHSRGAAIACLAAGTFPERVSALALLDGGVPIPAEPAEVPTRFAESITARERQRLIHGRIFANRNDAIAERSRGFTKTTMGAAEILAQRSLHPVEGGFSWFVDQRLKTESELRLSHEQISAFMTTISAPTLAILATDSPLSRRDWFQSLLRQIRQLEVIEVTGGHHCHLEGREQGIAAHVTPFLIANA